MVAGILIYIMVVLVITAFFSLIASKIASIASRKVRSWRSSGLLEGSDSDSASTSDESDGQQNQQHHHHDHSSGGWGGGDFGGGHQGGGGDFGGGDCTWRICVRAAGPRAGGGAGD